MKIRLLACLPLLLLFSCTGNEQKQTVQKQGDATAPQQTLARETYIDTTINNRHFSVNFIGDSAIIQTDSVERSFKLVCSHAKGNGVRIYDHDFHVGNFAVMDSVFVAAFFDNGTSRQMDIIIVQNKPPYNFLSTDSSGRLIWTMEPSTFHTEGAMVQLNKRAVLVFYDTDSVLVDKNNVEQQERWYTGRRLQLNAIGKVPKEFSIKGTGNEYADSADTEQLFYKMSKL